MGAVCSPPWREERSHVSETRFDCHPSRPSPVHCWSGACPISRSGGGGRSRRNTHPWDVGQITRLARTGHGGRGWPHNPLVGRLSLRSERNVRPALNRRKCIRRAPSSSGAQFLATLSRFGGAGEL